VNKAIILKKLIPVIEKAAAELGLTVLDVTFNKEHGKYFLRIFIYNPDSHITHGDCGNMTRSVNEIIDNMDLIEVPYSLEVSSPGINRKLKNLVEYEVFKGKEVKVTLKKFLSPDEKNNVLTGKLLGLTNNKESTIIRLNDTDREIKLDNIKTIQLED